MGRHTSFLGRSKVAHEWKDMYNRLEEGDHIDDVVFEIGEPDEVLDFKDYQTHSWISEEWKGFLRGGTVTRKLTIVTKDNRVVSWSGVNLDTPSW